MKDSAREREREKETQTARVQNVFPVQPWQHSDDENHVSIG